MSLIDRIREKLKAARAGVQHALGTDRAVNAINNATAPTTTLGQFIRPSTMIAAAGDVRSAVQSNPVEATKAAAKGLYSGFAQPILSLPAKYAPGISQDKRKKALDFLAKPGQYTAPTDTYAAINQGFNLGGQAGTYALGEAGIGAAAKAAPVLGTFLKGEGTAAKIANYGLRRATDVALGDATTDKENYIGGSRLKNAAANAALGGAFELAGSAVGAANRKLKVSNNVSKMNVKPSEVSQVGKTTSGNAINEVRKLKTVEVPNHQAEYFLKNDKLPEKGSILPRDYATSGKTKLVLDEKGKLVSWSTDSQKFADKMSQHKILDLPQGASSESGFMDMGAGKRGDGNPNPIRNSSLYGGESAAQYGNAPRKFSSMADKKPRFEINDANAKLTLPANMSGGTRKLSAILDHPELYKQYPELKNLNVKIVDQAGTGSALASFSPSTNTIEVTQAALKDKSTLLHEVQHALQSKEGFATGASLNSLAADEQAAMSRTLEPIRAQQEKLAPAYGAQVDKFNVAMKDAETKYGFNSPEYQKAKVEINAQHKANPVVQEMAALNKKANDLQFNSPSLGSNPMDYYKRHAGEVEARDVQARMNMTPEQRAATAPYTSQGVPVKDQIVKFDGGQANAAVPMANNPIVNPKTGETLSQAMEKLKSQGWSSKDITAFQKKVLGIKDTSPDIVPYKMTTDTLYHGTSPETAQSILSGGFKKGSELPENAYRGGGYGAVQDSVSLSTDPRIASSFSANTRNGSVIEAKLKPDANVVTVKGIDYAEDLNPRINELKKKGIDAVYLEGEKEVVVLDPKAVVTTGKSVDYRNVDASKTDFNKAFGRDSSMSSTGGNVPQIDPQAIQDAKYQLQALNEALPQHPGAGAVENATHEVQQVLQNSQAGSRYFSDGQFVSSSKSSFPDWVPASLRKKTLFNAVSDALDKGVPPKGAAQRDLYNLAQEQIQQRAAANPASEEYARMLAQKSQLESTIKSANVATQAPAATALATEAGKYKTPQEFAKAFTEKTSGVGSAFSSSKPIPKDAQALNDAFMEYAQRPEIQKMYQNGGNDTQVLERFYNETVAPQTTFSSSQTEQAAQGVHTQEAPAQPNTGEIVPGNRENVGQSSPVSQTELQPVQNQDSQLRSVENPSSGESVSGVSDFYNLDRMEVSDSTKQQVKSEIQNVKGRLEEVVGKTLSNREVIDLASQTSNILEKTVTREQTAEKIAANLNLRNAIAKSAEDGTVGKDFIDLWMKDKAAGEDIARQLQARSIIAKPKEAEAVNAILQGVYKVNKNADEIAAAAVGVDFKDPQQAAEFYRKFVQPKLSDWVGLVQYNSMLSSPNTHFNNIFSNAFSSGIVAPIEKTMTGAIDAVRSALTGSKRQHFAGEGVAYAQGYYSNVKKGFQAFADSMSGKSFETNPDVRSIPLFTKGNAKSVEKFLKIPVKLLEASDQFFTALVESGVTKSLGYRVEKGVKVSDIATKASDEAAYRLFRAGTNLSQEGHLLKSFDHVTNLIQGARSSDNPIVSTIARFTFPFVSTPMNIFKQSLEYSPMGVTTLWGAKNKTEQLAKAALGTAAAAGVATLLGTDRLTWAEPTSETQKDAFRAAGRQPYSVRVGDKWLSYTKLPPALAFNFALVASVDNAIKEKKIGQGTADIVLSTFAKYANFMADQSYVKSVGDFVSGTKGDSQGFARTLTNPATQLIPLRALGSWINRLIDPVQRKADPNGSILEKQIQNIMLQIPGLAQKLPTRNDSAGNPLPNQNRLLNAVSPVRVSNVNKEGEQAFGTLQSISKINQQQKSETDKLKEAAKSGDIDALMALTKAQRTTLKNSKAEEETRAKLSPIENAVYGLSREDQKALLSKNPDLASAINKVNGLSEDTSVAKAQYDLDLQHAKKKDDYNAYRKIQETEYQRLESYKNGLDEQLDKAEILRTQNTQEDILAQIEKYDGYGGSFKKPKKGKKLSTKKIGSSGSAGTLKTISTKGSAPSTSKKVALNFAGLNSGKTKALPTVNFSSSSAASGIRSASTGAIRAAAPKRLSFSQPAKQKSSSFRKPARLRTKSA